MTDESSLSSKSGTGNRVVLERYKAVLEASDQPTVTTPRKVSVTSSIASNSIFKIWDQELSKSHTTERNFKIRTRNSSNSCADLTKENIPISHTRSLSIDDTQITENNATPSVAITQAPSSENESAVVETKYMDIVIAAEPTLTEPTTPTKVEQKTPETPNRSPLRTASRRTIYSKPPSRPPPPIYHLHVIVKAQAIIRGWLSRKAFVKRKATYVKRARIVGEIVTTETSYVKGLKMLKDVFMVPLQKDESIKVWVSDESYKQLFGNLEIILGYHEILLEGLKERYAHWDNTMSKVGDLFVRLADFMKAYLSYVNNFTNAAYVLTTLRQNKDFDNWLTVCSLQQCEALDIRDLLITPVQRPPRYIMLLGDLSRNTWETHPDYDDLIKAKQKVTQITNFLNESKKQAEQINKVASIYALIVGLSNQNVKVSNTRRFVKEGALTQMDDQGEKRQYYWFLFNDLLIMTKPKKHLFKYKALAYLASTTIAKEDYKGKIALRIHFENTDLIAQSTTSEEETESWLLEIVSCRAELLQTENWGKVSKRKTFVHEELIHSLGIQEKKRPISVSADTKKNRPESTSPSSQQSGFKNTMKKIAGKVRGRSNSLRSSSSKLKYIMYLVGDQSTGKTAFAWRFAENKFEESIPADILQQKVFNKSIHLEDETLIMELQEIEPSEINENSLKEEWMNGTDGFVLLYHVANPKSFQYIINLDSQLEKIKKGYLKVLVGLGADLPDDQRKVTKVQGLDLAAKIGCHYFEASCKVPYNIEEPVMHALQMLLGNDTKKPTKPTAQEAATKEKEKDKTKEETDKRTSKRRETKTMDEFRKSNRKLFGKSTIAKTTTVFATHFEDIIQREGKGADVPEFVKLCFDFLLDTALNVENIFRTSGSLLKINEIKGRVDKGEKIHFQDEKIDCHTVAGLLRLYFRELPIPLVPFEFYQELVDLEAAKASHPNYLKDLSAIFKKFPQAHAKFLRALAVFLSEFAKNSEQNKMNSLNISMVFGPNALYSVVSDPQKQLKEGTNVKTLFQTIIDHHKELLGDL